MVVFHVKRGDCSESFYKASVCTSNDTLIRSLCRVQNLRLRLAALTNALEGWGHDSGVKPLLQKQILDEYQDEAADKQHQQFNKVDLIDRFTGEGVSLQLRNVLARVAADAKMALDSKTQVARRICVNESELLEKLHNIHKAVIAAFSMGLPARELDVENVEKALIDSSAVLDVLLEDTTELWWAGKQFVRDQTVRDLAGENEKSTLIVKLQKKGSGAPSQKPSGSEDERKAMMALYAKKQQKLQQTAEDNAEDYMVSLWADPQALKNSLRGTGSIRPF